jgi:hypothetical protein
MEELAEGFPRDYGDPTLGWHSLNLADEPVSDTTHREEVDGTGWISFQLLPEFHDVIVYRASGRVADLLRQLLARDAAACALNKKLEDSKLMGWLLRRRACYRE